MSEGELPGDGPVPPRARRSARKTPVVRDPGGRVCCRYCAEPVEPPRRTFCSAECVHQWKLRSNPGYARKCLRTRDRGVCALCLVDTGTLERGLKRLLKADRASWQSTWDGLVERGFDRGKSLWQADHLVPVAEGGGQCGLEGLRTLCVVCHKRETSRLRARLAKKKPIDVSATPAVECVQADERLPG